MRIQIFEMKIHEKPSNFAESGPVIWRILKTPHVLKACFIGSMLQAFQQLAGINTILYYTADIIRSAGIENYHTIIWISVILSICNLIGPFAPMFFIEKLGRRKLFLFSCAGVVVSLVLIGVSFLLVGNDSAPNFDRSAYLLAGNYQSNGEAESCLMLSNCDSCVTSEHCGFCEDSETRTGFCLPVDHNDVTLYSSTGLCTNGLDKSNSSFPNGTPDKNLSTKFKFVVKIYVDLTPILDIFWDISFRLKTGLNWPILA